MIINEFKSSDSEDGKIKILRRAPRNVYCVLKINMNDDFYVGSMNVCGCFNKTGGSSVLVEVFQSV